MNDSRSTPRRLFKANRRTIRAEVTLIIVIVISFSWSAYALYKIVVSNPDGSLFGFSLGPPSASKPTAAVKVPNVQPHQELTPAVSFGNRSSDSISSIDVSAGSTTQDLSEQLSQIKRQILKELLERQHQLLNPKANIASAMQNSELHSSMSEQTNGDNRLSNLQAHYPNQRYPSELTSTLQQPNIEEPNQWQGGYRMPQSLDNSLNVDKDLHNTNVADDFLRADRSFAGSTQAHSFVKPRSNLVPLKDAPSLMQLAHRVQLSDGTVDERPIRKRRKRPARIATEPELDPIDESQTTTTTPIPETTTTEAPPLAATESSPEATTMEPQSDESPDDTNANAEDGDSSEGSSPDSSDSLEQKDHDNSSEVSQPNNDDQSMERVRNTVRAIDEEVDRMTQPSLGMASQQEKSFDYKNTVQFDDSPPLTSNHYNKQLQRESRTDKNRRESEAGTNATNETDLQVADNRTKLPMPIGIVATQSKPPPSTIKNSRLADATSRSSARDITRMRERFRRSATSNEIALTLDAINPKLKRDKSTRRSDDEDDEEEGEEDNGTDNQEVQQDPDSDAKSNYHYITSNDPTLQELLAHKQLLDALQQSKLPAPMQSGQLQSQQQRLNSSFLDPQIYNAAPATRQQSSKATSTQDRQAADTQYTIDDGLLLYPASDEEHHHKSMGEKSKKMSQKKDKKKMTVAVKKGAHKKKKHKKEEKKYLKEKKFKGAKKGKKMSKGKGGKGGKKGKKFYKDKGFKKKGFKNIYVKNEFGQKKSYFDEFRDKDFKKKWKNYDDKYKYANMKKWQAKDVQGAKKMKDHGENFKKYDKGKWKKKYHKHQSSESAKKKKKHDEFD